MTTRIGLVGAGFIGGRHLDSLSLQEDVRVVGVPPHQHGAVEDAAIDLGLPLFVEKPLAADVATAERLAARIEGAGLLTSVGYHWRYLDTLEQAAELLAGTPARMVRAAWFDGTG